MKIKVPSRDAILWTFRWTWISIDTNSVNKVARLINAMDARNVLNLTSRNTMIRILLNKCQDWMLDWKVRA